MFIGLTGGERVGLIPNANNDKGEILFMFTKTNRENLERRVSCQQQ